MVENPTLRQMICKAFTGTINPVYIFERAKDFFNQRPNENP
jgi:hypothetical protein